MRPYLPLWAASADDTPLSTSSICKDKTITVTGTGSVYATPDIAKFTAGVVTEVDTSTDAMQKNAVLMDKVVNAIKGAGIPDKDIKTSRVNLEPVYNYQSQPQGATQKPQIVGYRATNNVTVTIRDMSRIGATVDAAASAGANQVNGVSFELSDDYAKSVYKQALNQAVGDGADKAKTIADAAGTGPIALKSLSESGQYYPQPIYFDMAPRAMSAGAGSVPTPVSPGEQKVQASVSMVYTFT